MDKNNVDSWTLDYFKSKLQKMKKANGLKISTNGSKDALKALYLQHQNLDVSDEQENEAESSNENHSESPPATAIDPSSNAQEQLSSETGSSAAAPLLAPRIGNPSIHSEVRKSAQKKREPPFSSSECARLIHVVTEPRNFLILCQLNERPSREELDIGLSDPFADNGAFTVLFNEKRTDDYEAIAAAATLPGRDEEPLDPSLADDAPVRLGRTLKAKYLELRRQLTVAYNNWSKSGQNDPENFWDFCMGNHLVFYFWHAIQTNDVDVNAYLRVAPDDAQSEEGVLCEENSTKRRGDAPPNGKRGKKAQAITIKIAVSEAEERMMLAFAGEAEARAKLHQSSLKLADMKIKLLRSKLASQHADGLEDDLVSDNDI